MKPEALNTDSFLTPDWPAPDNVKAITTTRTGGVSRAPYDSLNLADHVGDNLQDVATNRQRVCELLGFTQSPVWLKQVHGINVADTCTAKLHDEADAIFSSQKNQPCVVMTADCLPVLITNKQGTKVAAAHAGWRGLVAGIIEHTLNVFNQKPDELLIWLGPAIGPDAFEVGQDVYDAFVSQNAECASAFKQTDAAHYLADIVRLAKIRLEQQNYNQVYGGDFCTYKNSEQFYSYRRDNQTGRMASMIWISE